MAMQRLRIDLSERRTQLVIGGAIAVVIIVIVLFLVIGRRGQPPSAPMMGNMPAGANIPAGMPGMGMMGMGMMGNMPAGANMPAGMPGMGMMGMGMMGMMGGATAGTPTGETQPTITRKVPAGPPKEPSRADPFLVPVPQEMREALMRVDIVPPPRMTPLKAPMPTMVYTQVPFTRVAGVAISRGAYALLEGANGRTYIVSPGDVLEGFTVERIEPTGVVLRSEEGEESTVELKGAERAGVTPGMGGMPAPSMPGMGGMPVSGAPR